MNVDGVHVDEEYESDILKVWSFSLDEGTEEVFYQLTLGEYDNNLRIWKTKLHWDQYRPLGWLLPKDETRPPLPEYGREIETLVAGFVSRQDTLHRLQLLRTALLNGEQVEVDEVAIDEGWCTVRAAGSDTLIVVGDHPNATSPLTSLTLTTP